MINDDIFYGNLKGLLRTGKWNMNAAEAVALVQIIQEIDRRQQPPVITPKEEPIKKAKKKVK